MSPTPLSDFVENYDNQEHDDWDTGGHDYLDLDDDYEVLDEEWDYDAHEGMSHEEWEDWLENGP